MEKDESEEHDHRRREYRRLLRELAQEWNARYSELGIVRSRREERE